jgi:hypothetical protein
VVFESGIAYEAAFIAECRHAIADALRRLFGGNGADHGADFFESCPVRLGTRGEVGFDIGGFAVTGEGRNF